MRTVFLVMNKTHLFRNVNKYEQKILSIEMPACQKVTGTHKDINLGR